MFANCRKVKIRGYISLPLVLQLSFSDDFSKLHAHEIETTASDSYRCDLPRLRIVFRSISQQITVPHPSSLVRFEMTLSFFPASAVQKMELTISRVQAGVDLFMF